MDSDNEYLENKRRRKRKNRTEDFSEEEKMQLAALVRKERNLWDCNWRSNTALIDKSWINIANQMGKPKEKCKLAWVALRESYRYHQRTMKRSSDPLDQDTAYWKFAKQLSFLDNSKRNVKNLYPFIEVSNEDAMDNTLDKESPDSYMVKEEDYRNSNENNSENNISDASQDSINNQQETNTLERSNQQMSSDNSEMANLVHQLSKLVNAQTEFMRNFKGNFETLLYRKQLIACDALLQQLPKNVAETTLVEIQNYIVKKINDQQKNDRSNDFK